MTDLAGIQLRVIQALRTMEVPGEGLFMNPDGLIGERFAIYRNNVRANFVESLKASFPVLTQLVGEAYFGQLARQYLEVRPSRSGDILAVGEDFGEHIAGVHAGDEYGYLADVARFEWLVQESRLAPEAGTADLDALASVPAASYGALRFALHPSLRLFHSAFPILDIWRAHVGTQDLASIDLKAGEVHLAIYTLRFELGFACLSAAEHCFAAALGSGVTLEQALTLATRPDGQAAAPEVLTRLGALGLIARVY